MSKQFSYSQAQKSRAEKYGCDGICYSSTYMCPRAEYCDETRVREFVATVIGSIFALLSLLSPIIVILLIVWYLVVT